ncbi:Subtilisin-like protease [Euphorbia peplus]|nr:Subtilisin-like protease [Euphorbia peplus]
MFTTSLAISEALVPSTNNEKLETYIVFLEKPVETKGVCQDLDTWHQSYLPATTNNGLEQPHLLHSYRHVATGFAAKLTANHVLEMQKMDGFVSARTARKVSLLTTHTPSFLGLQTDSGLWKPSNAGKGMIIGVIDTGIVPDHPSFSAEGMPPPPAKWKGKCDNVTLCNNKLIGARNFDKSSNNIWDELKHGTHTASTAAGSHVQGASYFGQANGTASGMAPLAHLAIYKVSGDDGKAGESEILAAIDAAIEDGVDVISLSIGIGSHNPFHDDVIALGAFAAIKRGIFVSCGAGNLGPKNSSLSNEAPWILTVGSSTIDRAIRATVLLGNGSEFHGESMFQPNDFPSTLVPLVYAGANGKESSAYCETGSLANVDVKGKIVLCEGGSNHIDDQNVASGQEVKDEGGVGMILMNTQKESFITLPSLHVLPASHVSYAFGSAIKAYINSSTSPIATILFKGTVVGSQVPEAPQIAIDSSRGPSVASPGILKPDIVGPGVRVLAAWPKSIDNTTNKFQMASGTSMSCPHLSGIAALLKKVHPDWSPTAIKSAIMTTADVNNLGGKPISDQNFVVSTVFDMGAGHVNAKRATDPGLIYDMKPEDYIPYLCGLGYSNKQVGLIIQGKVVCSKASSIPEAQLNYPSFSIKLGSTPQTYTRTVTNVGQANSAYTLKMSAPQGVDIDVKPDKIYFLKSVNQKATYSITFRKNSKASGNFSQGYINWVAKGHNVRSPIAVLFE